MHRRAVLLVACIALVAGLGACSPATQTAPTSNAPSIADTATTPGSMVGSNPDVSALITVADVEKATGLTGLKTVTREQDPTALGRVNVATEEGTLVLMVNIGDRFAFDDSKAGMNFGVALGGLGDDAYVGPSAEVSKVKSIVATRVGDHAIILRTFARSGAADAATWLTTAQLEQLARLILSRWG